MIAEPDMRPPFTPAPEQRLSQSLQCLQAGDPRTAETLARSALEQVPAHPFGLTLLALALSAQQRTLEALPVFERLTSLQPAEPGHWTNLGNCLCELGRESDALAPLLRARALGANDAPLHFALARVYASLGPARTGLEHIDQAIAKDPTDAEFRVLRAQLLTGIDEWQQANEEIEHLLRWPLDADQRADLAFLLLRNSLYDQALEVFGAVRREQPDNLDARLGTVMVLERVNRVAEAERVFAALEISLGAGGNSRLREKVLQVRASLAARAGRYGEARGHLEELLRDCPLDPALRVNLWFDLGTALARLGLVDPAMEAFAHGHAERRAMVNSDHPTLTRADGLFSVLDEPTIVPRTTAMAPTDQRLDPVFVVGFPRSGTTLLEQLLDAHGALASFDEQPFVQRLVKRMYASGQALQEAIDDMDAASLQAQRDAYFSDVARVVPDLGSRRPVDKNPLNLIRLPLVQNFFPGSRVILAIRHPCDVVLSCYMQSFRAPAFAVTFESLESCADMYDRVFSSWWRARDSFQLPVFQLRYEDLVADTEAVARQLFGFLGLDWQSDLMDFTERARSKGAISTPSYTQVIEKVNSRAVGRWLAYRNHFGPTALARLSPWIEAFGYPHVVA